MRIAVVGSRSIVIKEIEKYISGADEIVSGGAVGVDACAAALSRRMGLKLTVFLPEYALYGRAAPIVRNKKIVDYADKIVAFWDGKSRGTKDMIDYMQQIGKHGSVIIYE